MKVVAYQSLWEVLFIYVHPLPVQFCGFRALEMKSKFHFLFLKLLFSSCFSLACFLASIVMGEKEDSRGRKHMRNFHSSSSEGQEKLAQGEYR